MEFCSRVETITSSGRIAVLHNTHWQHFIEKNPLIMFGPHLPGVYSAQLRMNVRKKNFIRNKTKCGSLIKPGIHLQTSAMSSTRALVNGTFHNSHSGHVPLLT